MILIAQYRGKRHFVQMAAIYQKKKRREVIRLSINYIGGIHYGTQCGKKSLALYGGEEV